MSQSRLVEEYKLDELSTYRRQALATNRYVWLVGMLTATLWKHCEKSKRDHWFHFCLANISKSSPEALRKILQDGPSDNPVDLPIFRFVWSSRIKYEAQLLRFWDMPFYLRIRYFRTYGKLKRLVATLEQLEADFKELRSVCQFDQDITSVNW